MGWSTTGYRGDEGWLVPAAAAASGLAFNTSVSDTFGSASSFALPSLTAPANCINVVTVSHSAGPTVTGVSDPTGSYTQLGYENGNISLWYAVRTSAQSGNVITITTSGACTTSAVGAAFTGCDTGSPIDTGGTYGATNSPFWTTSVANTILIASLGPNNGQWTSSAPWQTITQTGWYGGLIYNIVSSTQSSTTPVTSGDGGWFGSSCSALK